MENENNMNALQTEDQLSYNLNCYIKSFDHEDSSNDSDKQNNIKDKLDGSESEINDRAKELLAHSYLLWHYPHFTNDSSISNEILLKIIELMEPLLSKIKIPSVIPRYSPAITRCLESIRNHKIDKLFPNNEVSDFNNKIFSDLLLSLDLVVEPSPSKVMLPVISAKYYDDVEEETSKELKRKFASYVLMIYEVICKIITKKLAVKSYGLPPPLSPAHPSRLFDFRSRFLTLMDTLTHNNDYYTVASVVNVFKNNLNHLNKEYPYIPVLIVALNLAYINHIYFYSNCYYYKYTLDLEDVCRCFYTFYDYNKTVQVYSDKITEKFDVVIKEGPSSSENIASFKSIDDDDVNVKDVKEESTMEFYYGLGVGKINFDLIRFDFEGNILFRNDTSGDFKRYDREKKILVNMGDIAISTKHNIAYAIPVQINTVKENDVIVIEKDSGVSFGIVQWITDANKLKVIDVDNNVRELIFDSLFGTDLIMVSKVFTLMDLFKTNQNNMLPMLLMSKEKGENSMDTKTIMLMMMMNNNNGGNNNMNNMLPLLLMNKGKEDNPSDSKTMMLMMMINNNNGGNNNMNNMLPLLMMDDTCDMEDIILMSMLQNQNNNTEK